MRLDPADLPESARTFVRERHLATLTTVRADGSPHVTPVGFSWDDATGLARVITFASSAKVRHLTGRVDPRAAVCQVDGGRWLTFEGPATVTGDPDRVAEAVRRYADRYRQPGERPDRVAIEIMVDRILGRP
jgi:PPOX class probable F420-dependent enzyme